jgi:NADH:ubiquinone oxidoreductase subunit K
MNTYFLLYYFLSILFIISIVAFVLNRQNIIVLLIAMELALYTISFLFLIDSIYLDDSIGFIFFFFILIMAAIDSCLGLTFFVIYYRLQWTISMQYLHLLRI